MIGGKKTSSIEALLELESYQAIPELIKLQNDRNFYVRSWLMRSLGSYDCYTSTGILINALKDKNHWVRFWALQSIGDLNVLIAEKSVIEMMKNEKNRIVIESGIWALSRIGSHSAIEFFQNSKIGLQFADINEIIEKIQRNIEIANLNISFFIRNQEIKAVDTKDTENFLTTNKDTIKELSNKFSTYLRHDGKIVNEVTIVDWLKQFENVRWMNLALTLLKNIEFISRRRMTAMFEHFYNNFLKDQKKNITLCLFGNPADSSSLVNYFLADVAKKHKIEFYDLGTILETRDPNNTVIVFVDDNIGSAGQSIQIFREWLGIKEVRIKEHHVEQLSKQHINKLKKFEIYYFVCIGLTEGIEALIDELKKRNINLKSIYPFIRTEEKIGCFHKASGIFINPDELEEAKKMGELIGNSLFEDKQWSEEIIKERALGYGNSQKLIVFFYNVPTTTLPILWKKGTYKNKVWEPLFPRREKV